MAEKNARRAVADCVVPEVNGDWPRPSRSQCTIRESRVDMALGVGGLSKSPDNRHEAELVPAGEIPFGPEFFHLRIDSRSFGDRIFGIGILWSPNSTILAASEWHTIDRELGPISSLILLRPEDWTYFRFPVVRKGFAHVNCFLPNSLTLRHCESRYDEKSYTVQYETDIGTIAEWSPLESHCP